MKKTFNCPAELTVSLIGGKWKSILIYNLRRGPRRFGDLKRRSPGITPATLAQQLRELEASGLVARKQVGKDRIDGVSYALTAKGQSLKPIIYAMARWGLANRVDHALGEFRMEAFRA